MIKRSFERLGDALGMVIVLIALLVATKSLFRANDQKLDRKALDKKTARQISPVNVPLSA
ncbi:hypothetical protein [Hyphococcus lacteus]|uniref:CcoQ/FixQ family Cbb3-type cytochrome c oxidase assembly chaperone n=1 Tax=Hyphococcus lacteus TaxID=3143536 RepID=A0ABV3Z434_9PROT